MAAKQVASRVKVEMLFDIISPYAYIQLELLRRNRSNWPRMHLELKPIFLSGIIVGAKNIAPFRCEKKGNYILKDLKMLSDAFKIPLIMPENFFAKALAKNSLNVMRFLIAIESKLTADIFENLVRNLYRAHFSPGSVDLTDPAVFHRIAIESGVNENIAKAAIDRLNSEETKNQLRIITDKALDRGVFGVPTMFVHTEKGPEMVWGSDRMFSIGHLMGETKPPVFHE